MGGYNLTTLEKRFCLALADALDANVWGEANWSCGEIAGAGIPGVGAYWTSLIGPEDIVWPNRQQLGGLLTSLANKGVILVEERDGGEVDVWGLAGAVRALAL